jgi:hypothetical protein
MIHQRYIYFVPALKERHVCIAHQVTRKKSYEVIVCASYDLCINNVKQLFINARNQFPAPNCTSLSGRFSCQTLLVQQKGGTGNSAYVCTVK